MSSSTQQQLNSLEHEVTIMVVVNVLGGLMLIAAIVGCWWLVRRTKNSLARYKSVLTTHGESTEKLELELLHRSSVHNLMFMSGRRRSTVNTILRSNSIQHNRDITSSFKNTKIGQRYTICFRADGQGDGVTVTDSTITDVESKSSAAAAGFTPGMIITEVEGVKVTGSPTAKLTRKGLEKFQFSDLPENCEATISLLVPDISKKNAPPLHRLPLRKTDKGWLGVELIGVTVSDVVPGGPADVAGLRVGMVVRAVSGVPVTEDNIYEVIMEKENTNLFHVDVLVRHPSQPNHPPTPAAKLTTTLMADINFESDLNSEGTDSGSGGEN